MYSKIVALAWMILLVLSIIALRQIEIKISYEKVALVCFFIIAYTMLLGYAIGKDSKQKLIQ
jgi:hypothetical protein